MAKQPVITEVRGLRKLRSDLKEMGSEYRSALDKNLKKAAQPIVQDAKKRYRQEHPRRRGGRGSQRGIRAAAGGGRVRVVLGGGRYPYLLGQEWGSGKYPQFPARSKEGHFFWPAIRAGADRVTGDVQKALDSANAKHFEG